MHQAFFLAFIMAAMLSQPANAQQYDRLEKLKDHTTEIFYSSGHKERAESIANRVDKAMEHHQQLLGFRPDVTLLVLNEADWKKYSSVPVVYGMPHYDDKKTLVVAAEDNAFWKSFLPPLDQLPPDLANRIKSTYRNEEGQLSMQPFFDLLAIHELGHAFHFQAAINMQRKWMGELFVNILLHTYIAEKEPELLPVLTIFPQMVIAGGTRGLLYTSLKDVHEKYEEIGQKHPNNYGWYQCRWHSAAGSIYDAAGKQVGRKLWDALKGQKETLSDTTLVELLDRSADKNIADMIRNWDRDMLK